MGRKLDLIRRIGIQRIVNGWTFDQVQADSNRLSRKNLVELRKLLREEVGK